MARNALLVVAFLGSLAGGSLGGGSLGSGSLGSGSRMLAQEPIWRPYVEVEGLASGVREVGQGNLFLPLWQESESLVFADLRGLWTDVQSAEGNWGLAYRKILPSEWIVGAYGFYDLRHTRLGNNFQQATFGAELLSVNWGFRLNGYVPNRQVQLVPGLNAAFLQGNSIVVQRGEERAYFGVDCEVESLLWHQRHCGEVQGHGRKGPLARLDAEVWVAAGVFHFDNDTPAFEDITGPRFRAELRLYDLPKLGTDSRLVAGGQYEYDDVRGSVFTGMLAVRIPFGPGGGRSGSRLSPLDRRMVTPIIRDIDAVTNVAAVPEPAKVAHTGVPIGNVVVLDANGDIVNGALAAGANSVVIVDGSAGMFNIGSTLVLQNGQVVMGGGSQLAVVGGNTGVPAVFTGPGVRPTITHIANSPAITLASNNQVVGMTLQGAGAGGGNLGVFGTGDLGNVAIDDNVVDDFGGTGISLTNLTGNGSTRIANNTIRRAGADGIRFGTADSSSMSASIHSNVVENPALDGIQVTAFNSARLDLSMTSNVVRWAGADTVRFDLQGDSVTSLFFDGNRLTAPASDGIEFDVENNSKLVATISNNWIADTTFGEGIEVDQDQSSQARMHIVGNSITNTFADPLDIDLDDSSSGFYQVANNQFTSPQPASIIDIDTNDDASLGLQFFGNSSNVNFDFDEDGTSTFQLEDTLGSNWLTGGATLVIDPLIEIVPMGTFFSPPKQ